MPPYTPPHDGENASPGTLAEQPIFTLQLYVAGASQNSVRAIANLKALCETYLAGRYQLDVIDVRQERQVAETEQLIALPMLIRRGPLPEKRLIGDMGDTQKVLNALGIF